MLIFTSLLPSSILDLGLLFVLAVVNFLFSMLRIPTIITLVREWKLGHLQGIQHGEGVAIRKWTILNSYRLQRKGREQGLWAGWGWVWINGTRVIVWRERTMPRICCIVDMDGFGDRHSISWSLPLNSVGKEFGVASDSCSGVYLQDLKVWGFDWSRCRTAVSLTNCNYKLMS
jgi:hypothetical protein